MARKFTSADFKEHEKTYDAFVTLTKWSIFSLIFVVLALYCFIVADQAILGGVLLLVAIAAPIFKGVTSASKD